MATAANAEWTDVFVLVNAGNTIRVLGRHWRQAYTSSLVASALRRICKGMDMVDPTSP